MVESGMGAPHTSEVSESAAASVWTIVVAAGSGTRFGAPKQFLELGGQRVIDRSVATAARHGDGVVVVLPVGVDAGDLPAGTAEVVCVEGGDTRSTSVRNGLGAVPAEATVVLVHDAARPLAGDDLFVRVIAAVVDGADAVVPAVAVTDSIRHRHDGAVDRDALVAVQTPQGFAAHRLRSAHSRDVEATDDATLVEADGGGVVIVEGDHRNLKLTTPFDFEVARLAIEQEDVS